MIRMSKRKLWARGRFFRGHLRDHAKALIVMCLLFLCFLKILYDNSAVANEPIDYPDPEIVHPKIARDPVWKFEDKPNVLLNETNFFYEKIRRKSFCDISKEYPRLLLVMVTSSRSNFATRNTIRETWGSLTKYHQWNIRVVFLLSKYSDQEPPNQLQTMNKKINREMELYDDILIGNFKEEYKYRNLLSTLMGYKWALNHCRNTDFVLMTYENVYVELFKVLDRVPYFSSANTLLCFAEWSEAVSRNLGEKRFISEEEFPEEYFPPHCSPTVRIMAFNLVESIYLRSKETISFIYLEDVFLTGILRESIGFQITDIGFEYQFNYVQVLKWSHNGNYGTDQKLPWMFTMFNSNVKNYAEGYYDLWDKLVLVYAKVLSFETSRNSKYGYILDKYPEKNPKYRYNVNVSVH